MPDRIQSQGSVRIPGPSAVSKKCRVAMSRGGLFRSTNPRNIDIEIRKDVAGKELVDLTPSDIKKQIKDILRKEKATMAPKRVAALAVGFRKQINNLYNLSDFTFENVQVCTSRGGLLSSRTYIHVNLTVSGMASGKRLLELSKSDIKDQIRMQLRALGAPHVPSSEVNTLATRFLKEIKTKSTAAWEWQSAVQRKPTETPCPSVTAHGMLNNKSVARNFDFIDSRLKDVVSISDEELEKVVRMELDSNAEGISFSKEQVSATMQALKIKIKEAQNAAIDTVNAAMSQNQRQAPAIDAHTDLRSMSL